MADENDHKNGEHPVELDAYLTRIGYAESREPTVETLRGLHFAHATEIPFENLDIVLGRSIALDLESLQAKLVEGRRGGYCFEQNTLFAAVLEVLGFAVTRLAARVRYGSTAIRPRSHMLLSVKIDGNSWLADVGFGGDGLLFPIPLDLEDEIQQGAWSFRLRSDGDVHVLQSLRADGWFDLYAFTREPQYPVDYVVSNYFTSTYPYSPFVQSLVVQRTSLDARWILRNRELTETRSDRQTTIAVPDDDSLRVTLAQVFALHFPAGTKFRYASESTTPTS